MNKYIGKIFQSRVLSATIFFGLAGAIWGGSLYAGEPAATFPLTAIGGLILAMFGGVGLSLHTKSVRRVLVVLGLGFVGVVMGFGLAGLGIYPLLIWGTNIFVVFPGVLIDSIRLEPSLKVAAYWLNFAVSGGFIGLFFALGLKKKILPMVLRGAVGFGLAAIVGPIIGNLIGGLLNSPLTSYIVTFTVIGAALGISLTLQFSKKEKEGSIAQ